MLRERERERERERGIHGIMAIVESRHCVTVSNTLGKSMNPTIFPSAMDN